jgi:hypothetical protein
MRSFARSPVFAVTAVGSLAIGMGATTAAISLVNSLLLTSPPGIGSPERLVSVGRTQDGAGCDTFSYSTYLECRDHNGVFSSLAAMRFGPQSVSLAGPDGAEALQASVVSGNFFDVLQARPGPRQPGVGLARRGWSLEARRGAGPGPGRPEHDRPTAGAVIPGGQSGPGRAGPAAERPPR